MPAQVRSLLWLVEHGTNDQLVASRKAILEQLSAAFPAQCAPDVTQAMALAGARSIGNTIHATNHVVRARECWRAMWAAKDGEVEPIPTDPAVTSTDNKQ